MKMMGFVSIMLCTLFSTSCEKEELVFSSGDYEINVETGEHWFHEFPLFLGLTKKNEPQFAIWVEDTSGHYLSTVFVTHKIATEGWLANNGNRRKEALPYWCHQRGVVYNDGLMLPTKKQPLADGVTGATPKGNTKIQMRLTDSQEPFVIKAEFNHSVDFNDFYPKNAKEGEYGYSGGKLGSGQPAVVYAATVYPDTNVLTLKLVGHSSPDGSDGKLYTDLSTLTTAKSIVNRITILKK
jgi:hypothetical protein